MPDGLLSLIVGIVIVLFALKVLKGIVKTLVILIAVAVAAALYFGMGG